MRYLVLLSLLLSVTGIKAQFHMNGNAVMLNDSCFRLTEAVNWQVGSIWNPDKIDLRQSFDLVMEVFPGCQNGNGADGLVFGLQPVSTSIGTAGGDLGFGGVVPSLGVEIDTWFNPDLSDPAFDHMAIVANGNMHHNSSLAGPVAARTDRANIDNCRYYDLRISWDVNTQTLKVYFNCELRLTYTGDIINDIFNGDPLVFWGFTAATGGANNRQEICFTYTTFLDQLEDVVVCPGGQALLEVYGGETYEWSPAAGLSDPFVPDPVAAPDTTTLYTVMVFDVCQRPFVDTVLVTVAGDSVFFDLGPDTLLCEGETLALDVTTPTAVYEWSDGSTGPAFTVSAPGEYTVTVTRTDTFCTAADRLEVTYTPRPAIDLGHDTVICLEQTLMLTADWPGSQVRWSDGTTGDTLLVREAGTWRVFLDHYCGTLGDDIRVDIEDCRQFYLPTAFSPNDDGVNDVFYVQDGGDIREVVQFSLFNRWGDLVQQSVNFLPNDKSFGWDGKWQGKPATPGVYAWQLEVIFRDGHRQRFSGDVSLIR